MSPPHRSVRTAQQLRLGTSPQLAARLAAGARLAGEPLEGNAGEGIVMRMGRGHRACLGVVAALLMAPAGEAAAADSARGRRTAERWCAECHAVAPGQQRASDAIPTFAQIGRSERFNEAALAAFLANPHHSRMPNLSLTRSEIADLVAYIKRQAR